MTAKVIPYLSTTSKLEDTCMKCFINFDSRSKYESHYCDFSKNYVCTTCWTEFKNIQNFYQHIYQEAKDCIGCLKRQTEEILATITHKTFPPNIEKFLPSEPIKHKCFSKNSKKCLICAYVMNQSFACSHCSSEFSTDSDLRWHICNNHFYKYFCVECWNIYDSDEKLRNHVSDEHANKEYTCTECWIEMETEMQLKGHITLKHSKKNSIHTSIKPFKSKLCDYSSKTQQNLHEVTHTGVKPFKCKQCDCAKMHLERHEVNTGKTDILDIKTALRDTRDQQTATECNSVDKSTQTEETSKTKRYTQTAKVIDLVETSSQEKLSTGILQEACSVLETIKEDNNEEIDIIEETEKEETLKRQIRRHHCYFCGKKVMAIGRHLIAVHKDEPDVQAIQSLEPKNRERMKLISKLRGKGDFAHGTEHVKARKGKKSEVLPCPECKRFFVKVNLHKHFKYCTGVKSSKKIIQKSKLIKMLKEEKNPNIFKKHILLGMRNESIKKIIEEDPLLLIYGERLTNKHLRKDFHLKNMIRSRLNKVVAVYLKIKEKIPIKTLIEVFKPLYWKIFVKSLKEYTGFESGTVRAPSTVINVGVEYLKLSEVASSQAIIAKDRKMIKNIEQWVKLYKNSFNDELGHLTRKTRSKKM